MVLIETQINEIEIKITIQVKNLAKQQQISMDKIQSQLNAGIEKMFKLTKTQSSIKKALDETSIKST